MARFRAAERAPIRSLSGLGTCPSASQGLLSMESGASRRPQKAGAGEHSPEIRRGGGGSGEHLVPPPQSSAFPLAPLAVSPSHPA